MSHLPDIALKTWKRGDGLAAADLTANFEKLLGLIDICMHAALTPDPAARALEPKLSAAEERLDRIEQMLAMHARQRNEKEWAPMAHVAGVMQLVQTLIGPMRDHAERLLAAQHKAQTLHDDLERRLARLEQHPDYALAEDHAGLAQAHRALKTQADMTLGQATALRAELMYLRKLQEGNERLRNEKQYMPLATGGALLQRIMDIEKRLPVEEVPS